MKKIISKIILICLFSFSFNLGFSQPNDVSHKSANKNAIMIEGLGHGFCYSLNYERILLDFPKTKTTAQIGLSYYGEASGVIPLWMPITINQMFQTRRNQYIEVGFGRMLNDDGVYIDKETFINKYSFDDWVFRLGYRFHSKNEKWVFRLAYTPIYQDKNAFISWGGLAVGYRF